MGDAGLVIGLEGAGIRSFICYLHFVNVNGEVAVVAVDQRHTLVQGPLVCPSEEDVRAVKPSFVGHLLIDPTSVRQQEVVKKGKYFFIFYFKQLSAASLLAVIRQLAHNKYVQSQKGCFKVLQILKAQHI